MALELFKPFIITGWNRLHCTTIKQAKKWSSSRADRLGHLEEVIKDHR